MVRDCSECYRGKILAGQWKEESLLEKVLGSKWIAVELGLEMISDSVATHIKHHSRETPCLIWCMSRELSFGHNGQH